MQINRICTFRNAEEVETLQCAGLVRHLESSPPEDCYQSPYEDLITSQARRLLGHKLEGYLGRKVELCWFVRADAQKNRRKVCGVSDAINGRPARQHEHLETICEYVDTCVTTNSQNARSRPGDTNGSVHYYTIPYKSL